MEEKELIESLKNKEEEAYVELINLYGNRILRNLYLMTKNRAEAEDIVQETFIRVFKYIKNFKGDSSLYTWIYRISQNLLRDRYKNKITTITYEDMEESDLDSEDQVIKKIDREILRKELNNLDLIYKEVIILFYFEDLSIKEICQILDEKEGTLKSKLFRGRKILKKALEKGGKLHG